MNSKKQRIYICGSITGTTDYLERFARAEEELKAQNYEVFNPAKVCNEVPQLKHYEYMNICIPMLKMCKNIYILKGSENSKGATQEINYAIKHGMNRIYESDRSEQ